MPHDFQRSAIASARRSRRSEREIREFLGFHRPRARSDDDDDDDARASARASSSAKRFKANEDAIDAFHRLTLRYDDSHSMTNARSMTRARERTGNRTGARALDATAAGARDATRVATGANTLARAIERVDDDGNVALVVRNARDDASFVLHRALADASGRANANASKLTSLTLRGGKGLTKFGLDALVRALGEARHLKTLDIASCGLGEDAGEALARVLDDDGRALERLDARGNALGTRGAVALSKGLAATKTLKILNLAQNVIGLEGMEALAMALTRGESMESSTPSTSTVEELDVQHNGFGDDGCSALVRRGLGNLERLSLGFNGIGAIGARALADALKKRHRDDASEGGDMDLGDDANNIAKRMRALDLKCNIVGAEGAHALSDALDNVESLDLSNNGVRDGAKWIAKSLKNNSSMKELNLQANDMGDDDAWWLADALGANTSLKTLNLGSNAFGDAGASDLAADLRGNRSLQTLDLTRNGIGRVGASELMDALDENATLTRLGLSSNKIPAETAAEIKRRVGVRAECDWQLPTDDVSRNAAMRFN